MKQAGHFLILLPFAFLPAYLKHPLSIPAIYLNMAFLLNLFIFAPYHLVFANFKKF